MLAGSPDAGLELGIRAERVHTVWNGALECRLLRLHVSAGIRKADAAHGRERAHRRNRCAESPGSKMFGNRIAKNIKQLKSWAEREQRELLPALRRRHAGVFLRHRSLRRGRQRAGLAVRAGVRRAEDHRARSRAAAAQRGAGRAAGRHRHSGGAHPPAAAAPHRARRAVREVRRERATSSWWRRAGCSFWVNFTDYLDTGLFLDHRITRAATCATPRRASVS